MTNLVGEFTMNDPNYVVIVQGLKKCIVCLCIGIKSLGAISDQVSSSPASTLKGLVTSFVTQLSRDCKNTVILTFYMGKLRPSNLGGVLIPSVMFTTMDENEDVNKIISKIGSL